MADVVIDFLLVDCFCLSESESRDIPSTCTALLHPLSISAGREVTQRVKFRMTHVTINSALAKDIVRGRLVIC